MRLPHDSFGDQLAVFGPLSSGANQLAVLVSGFAEGGSCFMVNDSTATAASSSSFGGYREAF